VRFRVPIEEKGLDNSFDPALLVFNVEIRKCVNVEML
jgi:hypothetical protein